MGGSMSVGLMALFDDIATLAKAAAASIDDVAGQAAKAGTKAAGVVIDDTAVTPRYLTDFSPARELPVVGRIALGSLKNKLLFLLPAALILSLVLPQAITPLLMLGGAYLCYEGVEKIYEALFPHEAHAHEAPEGHGSRELHPPRLRVGVVEEQRLFAAGLEGRRLDLVDVGVGIARVDAQVRRGDGGPGAALGALRRSFPDEGENDEQEDRSGQDSHESVRRYSSQDVSSRGAPRTSFGVKRTAPRRSHPSHPLLL